jgi:hypothetical protein
MKAGLTFLVLLLTLALGDAALGHHSPALLYDLAKTISIEGAVTDYRFINPHVRMYIDVTDAAGKTQSWLAEGGTGAILRRRGWDGSEVKPGDVVRIVGNPSRDGSALIHWLVIELPNGKKLASEDIDPAHVEPLRH